MKHQIEIYSALQIRNGALEGFLNEGDWVILNYHNYNLFSQGFKTSQLTLKKVNTSNIISSIFVVESYGRLESQQYRKKQKFVFYGEKILLQHLLSGKYLSYSHRSSEQEIRLKYGKTGNCLFTIKPVFKCQAGFGRKIRIGQQICLQSIERLKFYIQLGDKKEDQLECYISMRKHQSSIVIVDRLNLPNKKQGKISNLLVYQLFKIQTESALDTFADHQGTFHIQFLKNINVYGSFIIIQPAIQGNETKQILIQYKSSVFIKFYSTSLYLGFDQLSNPQLYDSKSQNCIFKLQDYDKTQLMQNCTLKVKHIKSGLYLASAQQKLQLKDFSLINTFTLKKVEHKVLKITLLVNQIYQSFAILLTENILKNRPQLQQLTQQLIKFIFSPNLNQQNYLKMSQNIKLKITAAQQSLLAKVGFIKLIVQAIGLLINVLNVDKSEDRIFHQEELSNLMLILLGICYKNQQNTEIFIKFLPSIYEGISYNAGIVQALYYLFSDGNNLRAFQRAQHKIRKSKIRSIQLLIEHLYKKANWEDYTKQKILKLLQKLVRASKQQKLLLHQFSLIRALKQKKLVTIWNETKVEGEDVYVKIKQEFIEIGGLFQRKAKFSKEIDLVRAQFHFLCTLYSNPNPSNLKYFRTVFPQIALLNYLKTKIFAQQRKILLRIVIEIYLKPLTITRNNLISLSRNECVQSSKRYGDVDLQILQKIRDQIIETFKQGIVNQIVDQALYLYIKAIRRFYELHLLGDEQWEKLQKLMQNYLLTNYNLVDQYGEVKKLVEEILKSHEFSQQIKINRYMKVLIKTIQTHPFKCKQQFVNRAQIVLSKVIDAPFFSKQQQQFGFLSNLIKYSLEKDSQIFIKSCCLMRKISQRGYRLLEHLKSVIILDNQWYYNIVQQSKQLHQQVKTLLTEFRKIESEEKQLVGINLSISKKIIQLKSLMYRRQNMSQGQSVSSLMQNIIRQLNIHETILTFIRDQQRKMRDRSNNPIFVQMFDFLLSFFYNNFTNLNICIQEFRLIRWLFTYQDVGQSKLLYLLVSNPYSFQVLGVQLLESALLSIRNSRTPSCYAVMSLLNLILNKRTSNVKYVDLIAKQIINDPNLIQQLWRIKPEGFVYQGETFESENYCEYFGFYLSFVIKLFILIIQKSDHQKEIISLLRTKITLKSVISIFFLKDYLDQKALPYFGSYLAKVEAVKYCQKLYNFEEISSLQIKILGQMAIKFLYRLINSQQINQTDYPQITNKGIHQLYFESCKIQNDYGPIELQTFNLVFITIFYPFTLMISQKIFSSPTLQETKDQIMSLCASSAKNIRDLLTSLPKSRYHQHAKRYNEAIILIQEILKYKISFQPQETKQENQERLQYQYEDKQNYQIKKLHSIVGNCQILSEDGNHQKAVQIYKTIMILLYSPKVTLMLQNKVKTIKPIEDIQTILKIIDCISKIFDDQIIDSNKAYDLIWFFLESNQNLLELMLKTQKNSSLRNLNKLLAGMKNQDLFDLALGKYLEITNYLMDSFLSSKEILSENIFQLNQTQQVQKALNEKLICVIQTESFYYNKHSFYSQLSYFEQLSLKINCQKINQGFHINSALLYIQNQLSIIDPINRTKYFGLVKYILRLLRVYVNFMKQFKLRYITKQLLIKMRICLNIIYRAINPIDEKVIQFIHEEGYQQQFEILLLLNDSWQASLDQINTNESQRMKMSALKFDGWQRQWLQNSENLCENSVKLYGEQITYQWGGFPLQAALSIFDPLKKSLIMILKSLKCCDLQCASEILLAISTETIKANIKSIYYKHHHLFGRYTEVSVNPQIVPYKTNKYRLIAQSFCFENGVNLVSLLMYIQYKKQRPQLMNSYIKYCQYLNSYAEFASQFIDFFADFASLWVPSKEKMIAKNREQKIFQYFYTKMGRVQVIQNDKLYSIDFIKRPQCNVNREQRSHFINNINFISTQVKMESIVHQCKSLTIDFNSYADFSIRFRSLSFILFVEKYLLLIRVLNLILLLINNIYLILNSVDQGIILYTHFNLHDTFEKILVVNLSLTVIFFFVFCLRHVPAIIYRAKNELLQKEFRTFSPFKTKLYVFKSIITNNQVLYHFFFMALLFLVILNKLVAAALLLDLLFQIKRMKLILFTLWKAKSQIIYTFISFLLIHYFYAIFVYLIYAEETARAGYCNSFSQCFSFIFTVVYKMIGGFVGYIYYENYNKPDYQASFHFYNVLEDIYLIITYQIFYAVVLVIIIDQYSKNTLRYAQLRENLSLNCLICGLSRTVFNTSVNANFRSHIFAQHNVWNYVYYYQYLNKMTIRERNRLENLIVLKETIDWLPNGYARGFKQPTLTKISEQ